MPRLGVPIGSLRTLASGIRDWRTQSRDQSSAVTPSEKSARIAIDSDDSDENDNSDDDNAEADNTDARDLFNRLNKQTSQTISKTPLASQTKPSSSEQHDVGVVQSNSRPARESSVDSTESATSSDSSGTSSSSDGDEQEEDGNVEPPKTKPASEKEESSDETSESESDSESEEEMRNGDKGEDMRTTVTKRAPLNGASTTTTSTSATSTSSTDSSGESSDEDDSDSNSSDQEEDTREDAAMDIVTEQEAEDAQRRESDVASGKFELHRASEMTDAADIARIFTKANLEGKQLWYFTAPASLSLTVETKFDIPIDRAEKDMPILSHNGNDYSMEFGDSVVSNTIKILVPNKTGEKYSMLGDVPVNTVQFKQVVRLPALDGKATPVEGKALPARKPRAQPAGLKASYAPIGVVQGPKAKARSPSPSSESSDDETTPVPPGRPSPVKNTASSTSHVPASSAASSGKAKRKFTSESEDSEGSEESDSSDIRPSKKAKIQEDQVRGTSEGLSNKSKTPKKTPIVPPVPGIQKGSSSTTAPKKPAIPVPQQRTNEMKEAKSKGEAASGPPLILGKMTPIPPPLPSTGRQSVTPVPVPAPAVRASISQSPTPDTVASTSKEKHKKHGKAAAGEERAADAASGALQVAIPPRDGQEKRKPGRPKKDQSGEAKEAAPDAPKASMGISDEQPAPRKHGKPKKDRPAEAEDASRKHKDKSKDKTKGEASEKSPEMAPQPKKVTKILPPAIPGLASR